MDSFVRAALVGKNSNDIVAEISPLFITKDHLSSLKGTRWVDGEVSKIVKSFFNELTSYSGDQLVRKVDRAAVSPESGHASGAFLQQLFVPEASRSRPCCSQTMDAEMQHFQDRHHLVPDPHWRDSLDAGVC